MPSDVYNQQYFFVFLMQAASETPECQPNLTGDQERGGRGTHSSRTHAESRRKKIQHDAIKYLQIMRRGYWCRSSFSLVVNQLYSRCTQKSPVVWLCFVQIFLADIIHFLAAKVLVLKTVTPLLVPYPSKIRPTTLGGGGD